MTEKVATLIFTAITFVILYPVLSMVISYIFMEVFFTRECSKLFGRRQLVDVSADLNCTVLGYPLTFRQICLWPILLPILIVMKIVGIGRDEPELLPEWIKT
jgi:hypothetical protein